MLIVPAMDLRQGRIASHRYKHEWYDGLDPLVVIDGWSDAELVQLIDLDAHDDRSLGDSPNGGLVVQIAERRRGRMTYGGGVRTRERAKRAASLADKILLGSTAVREERFVDDVGASIGKERLILALTYAEEGTRRIGIGTDGNGHDEEYDILDLCERMADRVFAIMPGGKYREGGLCGPDVHFYEQLARRYGSRCKIIANGGIGEMVDIQRLRDVGAYAAVIGRAVLTGRLDLSKVIDVTK